MALSLTVEVTAQQLDLFLDSREVALANEVVAALRTDDCARVAASIAALRAEAPGRADLAAFDVLLGCLEKHRNTDFTALDTGSLDQLVSEIDKHVAPAAQFLGGEAPAFLNRLWRRLAEAAATFPFDRARPHAHAAELFLRAQAHDEAEQAAQAIAGGCREPVVLRWRALARYRTGGLPAARWQIFSLAWFAAETLPPVLGELAAAQLDLDWRRFRAEAETPDAAWFPAWCLLAHPELASALAGEISPAVEQAAQDIPGMLAYVVLTGILAVEQRGYSRALVEQRARLRAIDTGFFAAYMQSRMVRHR